jgi:hypothetical protein
MMRDERLGSAAERNTTCAQFSERRQLRNRSRYRSAQIIDVKEPVRACMSLTQSIRVENDGVQTIERPQLSNR